MTTAYPKRLIEVDLPIARISAHARREKSIRHGHISTLHIWWARRPLAACRAVLCAALWPDTGDRHCPQAFREAAIEHLNAFVKRVFPARINEEGHLLQSTASEESLQRWEAIAKGKTTLKLSEEADWLVLRGCLLDFIADFANWDNSTVTAYLDTSRALTKAAHEALGGVAGTRPLVVDPFAGGGAIPLEALRVGADAFASDLNPVAVLLNKAVLEFIPRYGSAEISMRDTEGQELTFHGLADAVRYWGKWVKDQAERELACFYPKDSDGSTPIAYIWARTVLSEAPGGGDIPVQVPLIRSLWLCKQSKRKVALRWVRDSRGIVQTQTFDIASEDGTVRKVRRPLLEVFEPKHDREVEDGTVARGSATCPVTEFTTPVASVRKQLREQRGGAATATLCAVVLTREDSVGRFYRTAIERDREAAKSADTELNRLRHADPQIVPDEELPLMSGVFNAPIYGHSTWASLFSPRQLLMMSTLARLIRQAGQQIQNTSSIDVATAVLTILAFALSKQADLGNALCAWEPIAQCPRHLFGRQAIGMVWDFAEGAPLGQSSGAFKVFVDGIARALESIGSDWITGTAVRASATLHPLPSDAAQCVFTDPPYYNAVPYADLSDFFYVWLRRTIGVQYPELLNASVCEKDDEICEMSGWDPIRYPHKTGQWFEERMTAAMKEARRVLTPDGIGLVVFAHKSTGGWEAQLQAMVNAGWTVSGSWPIDTENASRLRAQGSAALASSVHLVCRPRVDSNGDVTESIGEWRDILSELPKRIHEWMPRLASEGVVGADAIFACLGPALEIFSRYARVEKANGEAATLREYLEFVWATVSTEALALIFRDADASNLEPNARLTAMWLWTLGGGNKSNENKVRNAATQTEADQTSDDDEENAASSSKGNLSGGFTLEFDAARKIAQGLGVHLEQCESLVEVIGDKARLLSVAERTKHLFGKETEPGAAPSRKPSKSKQKTLFQELDQADETESGWTEIKGPVAGTTVLDRVHQAMILFAANRGELLKRFLVEDGIGKDARFWKLADNLNKLYPTGTDERRWVEGVLARKKGLGL